MQPVGDLTAISESRISKDCYDVLVLNVNDFVKKVSD